MGGGGSGGGGDSETTVRYAGYVEAKHSDFLAAIQAYRVTAIPLSPYSGYSDIEYSDAFFGAGYMISSFPSLYDMYGKFVAGLDVEALFTQILDDSVNNAAINNLVSAHATELEDDIIQNADPRFVTGLRDINSVMASSFIIGRAVIESTRVKAISKYDAGLRMSMLQVATNRWQQHLDWNKAVVMNYAELIKFYFSVAMDVDNHNLSMETKNRLWPFTILEYERAALGALQGAMNTKTDVGGASQTQKAIGGALGGAAAGAMIGSAYPGVGTAVGAVIGGALGAASAYL